MNINRSSYSQKKKKEAVRRLSHGGQRGVKGSRSTHPDDSRRYGQVTRRVRRSRDPMEGVGHDSRHGLFSGRTVFATDSPSSGTNLVIQRSVEGLSPGGDTPDTDQDLTRRVITSSDSSNLPTASTSLFGKSTQMTSNPESGIYSGETFSSRMFRAPQISTEDESRLVEARIPFQSSSPPKSLFSKHENIFGLATTKNPFESIVQQESLSSSSATGMPAETLFKSKDAAPGRDSVTRNLFGKTSKTSDANPTVVASDQSSVSSAKVLFRKDVPASGQLQPFTLAGDEQKSPTRALFGRVEGVTEPPSHCDRSDASSKRHLSPARAEAASKRTLTAFDDPFSSGSQSDITDLETFGATAAKRGDPKQKKPVIKRSGLFGKAIAEASGKDLQRHSRSRTRSHSPDVRKQQSPDERKQLIQVERKRHSPEKQVEDGRKKQRDENKPDKSNARKFSTSSSSSRRYARPEEIKKLSAIVVKGVPPSANSRTFLKGFFSQYGSVTRVSTNPSKNTATITFSNHESAAEAKKKVRELKRGTEQVSIFWRQGEQGARSENRLSRDEVPIVRSQVVKRDIPRQLLATYNRKQDMGLNPEDGTSIMPQGTSRGSTASQQKTMTLSVSAHLLSKSVGLTAQERYDILEDRDKIIRQGLKKQSNLVTAKAIKGTCSDMCPEKERYMRVVQRRLHAYEVLPGTTDKVNHDAAVKEYSRSSADQEEPLPHEMRPASVLTMTMNYLMRHIMNMGRDGHWEEWFDFLWSRTRGIRKDITQQDLCDLTAIDLMEKCARFHIFCSHRLCAEDRSTIDPKINNENLTKCMQSLKQFYHDLASEGVVCPNEAEFRAYDVLLNLNDRDILRQVQQYRMDVRSSEPVKFALKAFSAVSSNNYVKFFKLVRSATYLNACIMYRYFMQVRNMALDVMNKAYTFSSTRGSNFPLVNMLTLLAFDDMAQASEFCQSHNLTIEDDVVTFNRAAFQHPDITPVMKRSQTIIEAKNTMSIGEVVNGGPLPPEVHHQPMSSFDENGHYKGYTVVAVATGPPDNDQPVPTERQQVMAENAFKPIENQMFTAPSTALTELPQMAWKMQYSNTEIKEVARQMFLEVIDEMARELSNSFLHWIHLIRVGSTEILEETFDGTTSPLIRGIAEEAILEQRLQEEKQRHYEAQQAEMTRQRHLEQEQQERQALMEKRQRLEQMAQGITEETIATVVEEEAHRMATNEVSAIQKRLKQESIERCIAQLSREFIGETVDVESRRVSTEVIQTETALRDQRLSEIEKAVILGRQARYLQRWHSVYTKRIRLKQMLLTFPAAPPNQTPEEQLRVLWAGRKETIEVTDPHRPRNRTGVTLDSPFGIQTNREHIAQSILRIHYLKNLRYQQAWSPLDLPSILGSSFHSHHAPGAGGDYHGNRQQHHYWKLVASLPSVRSHDQDVLCDWLKAKLRRGKLSEGVRRGQLGDTDEVETLSLYSTKVLHTSPHKVCALSVCTKVMTGSLDLMQLSQHQKRSQLLGTSGIMFALDPPSGDENDWLQAKSRLDFILQAKPASPPTPLVIALLDWSATEHAQCMCNERLGLSRLSQMGFVSSYRFIGVTRDVEAPQNSQELGESLEWLASRCPPPPSLSEDSLKGYLDTGMTVFFSLSLHEDARTRRDACLPEQECRHVINLYNATVRHLADAASSGSLTSLSWPPTEFTRTDKQSELPSPDWNSREHIRRLRDRILSLQLPGLPSIEEDDDWQRVCEFCHQYLLSLPGSQKSKPPLFARVQRILEKCRRTFEDTCYLAFEAPGCAPVAGQVPWTRIIEECVDYVMSTVQLHDLDDDEEGKQLTVFYIQSEFDAFEVPWTWKEAINATREESFVQPPRFVSQVASVVQQKRSEFIEKCHEATMIEMKCQETSVTVLDSEPSLVVAAKDSAEAVKTVLSSAKQESKRFDDLLQQWLHGTEGTTSLDGNNASATQADGYMRTSAVSSPLLDQSLEDLRRNIQSGKRADRLAELRLASLLSL